MMPNVTDVAEVAGGVAVGAAIEGAMHGTTETIPCYYSHHKKTYELLCEKFLALPALLPKRLPVSWETDRSGVEANQEISLRSRIPLTGNNGRIERYKTREAYFFQNNAESPFNPFKAEILNIIATYLELVVACTTKYNNSNCQWTYSYTERTDSPDVLLMTYIGDVIESSNLNEITAVELENLKTLCSQMNEYAFYKVFDSRSLTGRLYDIQKKFEEMEKVLPVVQTRFDLPRLFNELNNYLLYDLDRVFQFVYKCCTGAKSNFDALSFNNSPNNEAETIRTSMIGRFILEILYKCEFAREFVLNGNQLTAADLTEELMLITNAKTQFNDAASTQYVNLGLLDIFNDAGRHEAAEHFFTLLSTGHELYVYTKNINLLKKAIEDHGPAHILNVDVNLIEAHFDHIESLHQRLIAQAATVKTFMNDAMAAHATRNKRTTSGPFYKNLNDGMTKFNRDERHNKQNITQTRVALFETLKQFNANPEVLDATNDILSFLQVVRSYYEYNGVDSEDPNYQLCVQNINTLQTAQVLPTEPVMQGVLLLTEGGDAHAGNYNQEFVQRIVGILNELMIYRITDQVNQDYLNNLLNPLGNFQALEAAGVAWRSPFFDDSDR